MARPYKTPGVYVEEIRKFPPSVAQVETAIPAFIGHTQKAEKDGKQLVDLSATPPKLIPVRLASLLEYEQYFGKGQTEQHILVTINETRDAQGNTLGIETTAAFNGDRSRHNMHNSLQAYFDNGGGPCYIFSVGPYDGTFANPIDVNKLKAALPFVAKEDEPTLLVFPEAQGVGSMIDARGLYDAALEQCADLKDRFVIMDVYDQNPDINSAINNFRNDGVGMDNLKYGAAYYPNLEMIFDYDFKDVTVQVAHKVTVGGNTDTTDTTMDQLDSALYARAKNAVYQMPMLLPPSPVMAGIYADVDADRGVWKAPANVGVRSVVKPSLKISDREQENLNVDVTAGKSVNVIRSFIGKGTLVWGARTLAGNDNEWRYVSVRRFFNMVEESVKKASGQFVFEPNDANTWTRIRGMIENFLILQWRAGALAGAVPEQAFYVKVGLGQTMTPVDILEGRLIIEIGMAAVRPAEFIILKFAHKMQEA